MTIQNDYKHGYLVGKNLVVTIFEPVGRKSLILFNREVRSLGNFFHIYTRDGLLDRVEKRTSRSKRYGVVANCWVQDQSFFVEHQFKEFCDGDKHFKKNHAGKVKLEHFKIIDEIDGLTTDLVFRFCSYLYSRLAERVADDDFLSDKFIKESIEMATERLIETIRQASNSNNITNIQQLKE